MKLILKLTLLVFIIHQFTKVKCSYNSQGMEFTLINDYLKENNLKVCVILSCNKTQDNFERLKMLHDKSDIWYNFYDISNDYIKLTRLSHRMGVVIDLNCTEIDKFLREISKRIFFHHERYWLMFSPDINRTFDVLQNQNINVDAEISIAIPIEGNVKK